METKSEDAIFEKSDADIQKDAKRERLLNNLKQGRETALANRKKKALHTKLKRQEADEIMDNEIKQRLDKKATLENENKQLKDRLLALEMQNVVKKEAPPAEKTVERPKVEEHVPDQVVMSLFDKTPW
jgi:hypothetical protein